jgi:molybdenum cofactor guanylyltransferase
MNISAVLLAGGNSRRMGKDKASLLLEGEPLWQRQLRTIRQLDPAEIFLSARAKPDWLPPETRLVLDESPSRGAMSGIAAALKRAKTSHVLVLAIDMPFVTAVHLRALRQGINRGQGVVPFFNGRAEPLAALYPVETQLDFAVALRNREFSLQPLIRRLVADGRLRMLELSQAEATYYRSLNTPADLIANGAL